MKSLLAPVIALLILLGLLFVAVWVFVLQQHTPGIVCYSVSGYLHMLVDWTWRSLSPLQTS